MAELEITRVTGTFSVTRNESLAEVALPEVREIRALSVSHHPSLEALSFPALERVQSARVTENPELPHCVVEALLAQVEIEEVLCGGNLVDACDAWCVAEP